MTTQPLLTQANANAFHKVIDQVQALATRNVEDDAELATVRDNLNKAVDAANGFGMLSLKEDLRAMHVAFEARLANDNKGQKAAFTKKLRQFSGEAKKLHAEVEKRLNKDERTAEKFRGTAGGDQGGATQPVAITTADGTVVTATKKAAGVKAPKAPKAPKEKAPPKLQPCHCGCGEMVPNLFKMGHDAKLKSLLLKVGRGQASMNDVPEVALPMLGDFCTRWGIPYVINDHVGTRRMTIEAKPLAPRAPKTKKAEAEAEATPAALTENEEQAMEGQQ